MVIRKLYARFLKYRYFVRLEKPLIVCEGKTDSIYLKCAIRMLVNFQPILGSWDRKNFFSKVSHFSYTNKSHQILGLNGGTGNLKYFFIKNGYKQDIHGFEHRPLNCPVIVLIDNDNGAKSIFSTISENYNISIDFESDDDFYHVTDNLYLVKTPKISKKNKSYIEMLFERNLLDKKVNGKKFNPRHKIDSETEFGKTYFAEKVVRAGVNSIEFKGFEPLLKRIVSAMTHYQKNRSL